MSGRTAEQFKQWSSQSHGFTVVSSPAKTVVYTSGIAAKSSHSLPSTPATSRRSEQSREGMRAPGYMSPTRHSQLLEASSRPIALLRKLSHVKGGPVPWVVPDTTRGRIPDGASQFSLARPAKSHGRHQPPHAQLVTTEQAMRLPAGTGVQLERQIAAGEKKGSGAIRSSMLRLACQHKTRAWTPGIIIECAAVSWSSWWFHAIQSVVPGSQVV
jgi:hypothetical protein